MGLNRAGSGHSEILRISARVRKWGIRCAFAVSEGMVVRVRLLADIVLSMVCWVVLIEITLTYVGVLFRVILACLFIDVCGMRQCDFHRPIVKRYYNGCCHGSDPWYTLLITVCLGTDMLCVIGTRPTTYSQRAGETFPWFDGVASLCGRCRQFSSNWSIPSILQRVISCVVSMSVTCVFRSV